MCRSNAVRILLADGSRLVVVLGHEPSGSASVGKAGGSAGFVAAWGRTLCGAAARLGFSVGDIGLVVAGREGRGLLGPPAGEAAQCRQRLGCAHRSGTLRLHLRGQGGSVAPGVDILLSGECLYHRVERGGQTTQHIADDLGEKGKSGVLASTTTWEAFLRNASNRVAHHFTPQHAAWIG